MRLGFRRRERRQRANALGRYLSASRPDNALPFVVPAAALAVGGCGLLGIWLQWWAAEAGAIIILFALACLRAIDGMKTPAYLGKAAADLRAVLRLSQDIRQDAQAMARKQMLVAPTSPAATQAHQQPPHGETASDFQIGIRPTRSAVGPGAPRARGAGR